MKYLTVLGDGMSDLPLPELNGKTPLERAHKPYMDKLATLGKQGLVLNVPEGMSPGSDVANMSAMGVNPVPYYTGRSPLEAVSMGIKLNDGDIAIRTNFVTLSEETNLSAATMLDYSAGEISSAEAAELVTFLNENLDWGPRVLYAGKSYRHCMVWPNGPTSCKLTPPHDIFGKNIADYLPQGDGSKELLDLMLASREVLATHPVNLARKAAGKNPASIIWPWGLGTRPAFPSFQERFGLQGTVISAVDLVQGIGLVAEMEILHIEGATGTLSSNFKGKADAAIDAFKRGQDYVYLHLEAPDECGHQGDIAGKIKAIEIVDEKILAPLLEYLEAEKAKSGEDYRVFVLPDHPTPLALRTHTSDPVPYILYDSAVDAALSETQETTDAYTEANAKAARPEVALGYALVAEVLRA